jgi:hypothetical protein
MHWTAQIFRFILSMQQSSFSIFNPSKEKKVIIQFLFGKWIKCQTYAYQPSWLRLFMVSSAPSDECWDPTLS